jgi:hypothetical protein
MTQFCGICLSPVIYHDSYLGINVCGKCGAHQTTGGWQKRERRVNDRLVPVDRRHRQTNGQHTKTCPNETVQ